MLCTEKLKIVFSYSCKKFVIIQKLQKKNKKKHEINLSQMNQIGSSHFHIHFHYHFAECQISSFRRRSFHFLNKKSNKAYCQNISNPRPMS